ncbi:MAG TPA: acyl-CoA dehydrogenase family protein [Anaerolineales bacterium]|nr:acyl-CoA dehydrogenase family protein [Anaerolineales bacterium]
MSPAFSANQWNEVLYAIQARSMLADQDGRLPAADIQDLYRCGAFGLSIPQELGGVGGNLLLCTEHILQLAQASTSTALVLAMTLHIMGHAAETGFWLDGKYALLAEWVLAGGLVNSLASEPQLGSPSRGGLPQTELIPTAGGEYLLNGRKNWATGGEHLAYLLVRARLGENAVIALVPNHQHGIRWEHTWHNALSLRASDSHDVYFEAVRLPADCLVDVTQTVKPPNGWFTQLISATYLGTAIAAKNFIVKYARERIPTALGKPIATLPNIQRMVGEMEIALQTAEMFLLHAAQTWTGKNPHTEYPRIVAAKHIAVENAMHATELALRIAGGASVSADSPLQKYFRDARAGLMHPPSGDQALEWVGRTVLANETGT